MGMLLQINTVVSKASENLAMAINQSDIDSLSQIVIWIGITMISVSFVGLYYMYRQVQATNNKMLERDDKHSQEVRDNNIRLEGLIIKSTTALVENTQSNVALQRSNEALYDAVHQLELIIMTKFK